MDIHQELKELSKFLSEYSTSLMAVGVQTSRIVRNTSRIAESFGFFCDMTIFQKTIIMTLRDADNSHSYSTVNKIKPMGLNFAINSALSTLSWEAYDEHLSLTELQRSRNSQQAARKQMARTDPRCFCQCVILPPVPRRLYFYGDRIRRHPGRLLRPYRTNGTSLESSGSIHHLFVHRLDDRQHRLPDALGNHSGYGFGYQRPLPDPGCTTDQLHHGHHRRTCTGGNIEIY